MPVEPPPSRWLIPSPDRTDVEGLIGVGADLEPGTVLAAYRAGAFPMPVDGVLAWFSPDPRAVLPLRPVGEAGPIEGSGGVEGSGAAAGSGTSHPPALSRTLRRARRRFEIRVDTAFADVVAGCADPRRPGGWITPEMTRMYGRLHELGWAHSVEAWTPDGRLAGGLFGIAVGGLFAAESMFSARTDGSKAAVVGLIELLGAEPDAVHRVVDVQWSSAHLQTLGVMEVPRAAYLESIRRAVTLPHPSALARA